MSSNVFGIRRIWRPKVRRVEQENGTRASLEVGQGEFGSAPPVFGRSATFRMDAECGDFMELTLKQQEVLDFIHAYFAKQGMAPSVREIAEALGKSAQAIQQHIESLRAKGYLQHQPSKSRTNVPVQSHPYSHERINEVPMLGRVQAGLPVLAEE